MKKRSFKPNLKSKDDVCLSNSKLSWFHRRELTGKGSVWDAEQMLKKSYICTFEDIMIKVMGAVKVMLFKVNIDIFLRLFMTEYNSLTFVSFRIKP